MVKDSEKADKKSEEAVAQEEVLTQVEGNETEESEKEEKVEATLNNQANGTREEKEAEIKLNPEEELRIELSQYKDKYLRLYSDFENFRRRTAKEKLRLTVSANESLLQALLPILDDFERAEKSMTEDAEGTNVKEGINLIYNKFKGLLEQKGLKKIDAEKGVEFDVEFHEAVTQIPASDESLQGKIVDVVEKGYQLNDKVIRFSKVVTGA